MYIIITACLMLGSGVMKLGDCQDFTIAAYPGNPTPFACMRKGQIEAGLWAAKNPDWSIKKISCPRIKDKNPKEEI